MLLLLIAIVFVCPFLNTSCSPALPSAESKRMIRVNYELRAGLKRRGIQQEFNNYRLYVADLLEKSRVPQGLSEKTGKCRLKWVQELIRDPLPALNQAEQFTRELFRQVRRGSLQDVIKIAATKLDLTITAPKANQKPLSDPVDRILQVAQESRLAVQQAFRSLPEAERQKLKEQLYVESTANTTQGYRFGDKEEAAELIELLDRIDYSAFLPPAQELAALIDSNWIKSLTFKEQNSAMSYPYTRGEILDKRQNKSCTVLIGGPGKNEYFLDEMSDVCAIVDVGGDDIYNEGTVTADRPVLLLIDLDGNDLYRGTKPAIQGSSIMGISLLWDLNGNDKYSGNDLSQGSAIAGIGILVDDRGNDTYLGDRRVQGQALGGIGLLVDSSGDDKYRGALMAQGVGGPRGFGMLADSSGTDHYFAGGKYIDSYEDTPGFGSWSQGMGIGIRGVAEGGIGVLLDGGGNDVYEADYFSHGGGYWFAAGFARDFAGNDRRVGATRLNFDGSSRKEPRFLRWGIGFSCHYSNGFVFDDEGNDTYNGDWAVMAYAWDIGEAALCDFSGDDIYQSNGTGPAQSRNVALAILYDRSGRDIYRGKGLGEAEEKSESHVTGKARSSFALLLDDTGQDNFPSPMGNHRELRRNWAGGFFVDR